MACSDNKITKILTDAFPDILAIYVYGSTVNENVHKDSDLDIAILLHNGKHPDMIRMLNIMAELEQLASRPVDIGVLTTENPVYAKEVLNKGRLIYCKNKQLHDVFEMYVFSFYAKLNDERKHVLRQYLL